MSGRSICALLIVALSVAPAAADWPAARHDARRSGQTTGRSNLQNPAAYWRQYLGGALGPTGAMPLGDGDVAYLGGGRVRVLSSLGVPRWTSDNLELSGFVALADLDGDGAPELIARSSDRAFVFAPTTGALLWAETSGEMGTLGDVRVADVDGRAGAELTVQECGCCAVRSSTPGVVWSFGDGWAAPRRVWTLPSAACGGARQMQFADVTGDGSVDFVLSTASDLRLLDGGTGAVVATTPDLGVWLSMATCEAHDVLPGAGAELVCWMGSTLRAPGTGHQVFVAQYAAAPARLEVRWSVDVGDRDTDPPLGVERVADLDRDGQLEVLATGTQANGMAITAVLDAATGVTLALLPGQQHVAPLAPTATDSLILTRTDQQLIGWRFVRAATPRATLLWRLKDRRALPTIDPARRGVAPLTQGLVQFDANGDGAIDLATVDTKRPSELLVYDVRNPADTTLASWRGAPGSTVLAAWLDGARLVVSTSDGVLTTLAVPSLAPIGAFRAGQYYDPGGWQTLDRAAVAAQLQGDAAAELVVTDSRRAIVTLDARRATNADPPVKLWELPQTFAPTIVADLEGFPGMICRRRDDSTVPPTESIVRLDGGGSLEWERTLDGDGWNDVVIGRFDADAVPDVAVQWGRASDPDIRTTALSGVDGQPLWTTSANPGPAKFPSGIAAADWNGDGRDDVVFHHYGTRIYSGGTGATLANVATTTTTYLLPTVANVDADPAPELILSGGFSAARVLDHDLATALWTGDEDRPYPYAATTSCQGRAHVLTASLTPGVLKLIDPTGVGLVRAAVVAGGAVFPTAEAATMAGHRPGLVTSPTVHADLTGRGRPSVVIGSTDGWLYALDPCAGTLDFAVPFGAPVGAVAFADTDGDGNDELLVSVADGYLYALKHAPLAGPAVVRDLDVTGGGTDDVDEVTTRDTLSASWDAVPGATGYEVAIANADGGYVFYPPWQPVDATSYTRAGLTLTDGARYVVAVRAVSAAGRSPDILSDGVLVHLAPAPALDAGVDAGAAPPGDGGCCGAGASPVSSAPVALFAVWWWRRRRQRA